MASHWLSSTPPQLDSSPKPCVELSSCGDEQDHAGLPIPPGITRRGGHGRAQPLRRGMGKPGFPIPPPGGRVWASKAFPGEPLYPIADAGLRPAHPGPGPREGAALAQEDGETRFPHPPTRWEGVGGLRPPTKNRMFIAALCGGAAWMAAVTIVRRVLPPSQPPPAGGRSRMPAPGGGGSGREPAPCPRSRGAGGTPALPGRVHRAWCAMRMTV